MPKWNYMSKQPDITYSMRSILVDWVVEVAEEYKLQAETLYLAVSYIDRSVLQYLVRICTSNDEHPAVLIPESEKTEPTGNR